MKKLINFITNIFKFILSIINFVLITIIVFNALILLSSLVAKSKYPTILDFTYHKVNITDRENHLTEGDLLLIDSRKAYEINNIVMYDNNKTSEAGKIADIKNMDIIIKSNNQEINVNKEKIIGPMVINIPYLGYVIDIILKPASLVISIVILIITSILQGQLHKKIKTTKESKPDFKQMKNL